MQYHSTGKKKKRFSVNDADIAICNSKTKIKPVVRYIPAHTCSIDQAHLGMVTGEDILEERTMSGVLGPRLSLGSTGSQRAAGI